MNLAKVYTNALRATLINMPEDTTELISFFRDVESQMNRLHVPANLQAMLLRTFINKIAKILLTRLDAETAEDYGKVKEYLVRAMKLTPRVYLERFQSLTKVVNETCVIRVTPQGNPRFIFIKSFRNNYRPVKIITCCRSLEAIIRRHTRGAAC